MTYSNICINRVKELREKQGFTQDDLARCVGISRQALCLIEKGNNPRVAVALRICAVLDKPIQEVFYFG